MKLSVVMPTYNRSALLARALRGLLLEQTAPASDYEVVVVDDGSTDVTAQVVAQVGAPEERLRYFRQENRGPAAARNLGVREAGGDIILFAGDDCLPDERLIEEHLRAHVDRDVGVVGHVAWHPELELTPLMMFLDQGAQFGFHYIRDPENAGPWVFYTANCSVRRHWIEQVGGFDEQFRYAAYEDIELAYRMHQRGLRIIYHKPALTYHHHAPTLEGHMRRQRLCGRAAVLFWRKHPELKEELGIADAARSLTVMKLYEAASGYAYALGVRDAMRGQEPPLDADLDDLYRDPEMAAAGRAWVKEVFGEVDREKQELLWLRAELHLLQREWKRVTSRRLYRWSESLARAGWAALRAVGIGRRPGQA